jgi:hypothetical protein
MWVRPPMRVKLRLRVTSDDQDTSNNVGVISDAKPMPKGDLRQKEDEATIVTKKCDL